jgi:hypothetical protein
LDDQTPYISTVLLAQIKSKFTQITDVVPYFLLNEISA